MLLGVPSSRPAHRADWAPARHRVPREGQGSAAAAKPTVGSPGATRASPVSPPCVPCSLPSAVSTWLFAIGSITANGLKLSPHEQQPAHTPEVMIVAGRGSLGAALLLCAVCSVAGCRDDSVSVVVPGSSESGESANVPAGSTADGQPPGAQQQQSSVATGTGIPPVRGEVRTRTGPGTPYTPSPPEETRVPPTTTSLGAPLADNAPGSTTTPYMSPPPVEVPPTGSSPGAPPTDNDPGSTITPDPSPGPS
jgi:hypothetical protein